MSSNTTVTTDYFCDLCGTRTPLRDLTKLFMRRAPADVYSYSTSMCNHQDRDVCRECLRKPVSDLVEAFEHLWGKS